MRRTFFVRILAIEVIGALGMVLASLSALPAFAQGSVPVTVQTGGPGALCTPPQTDNSYIAPDGTAHVTRVVPVPETVSAAAQKFLARVVADLPDTQTLEQRRELDGG